MAKQGSFIKELNSAKPSSAKAKTFDYQRPVVRPDAPITANVQTRLVRQSQAPKGKSTLVKEQLTQISSKKA